MPNIKSAEKALRQSKTRAQKNLSDKLRIKAAVKSLKTQSKSPDILTSKYSEVQSLLDKAVKNRQIHKNKAARLKGRLIKRINAQHLKALPNSKATSKSGKKS